MKKWSFYEFISSEPNLKTKEVIGKLTTIYSQESNNLLRELDRKHRENKFGQETLHVNLLFRVSILVLFEPSKPFVYAARSNETIWVARLLKPIDNGNEIFTLTCANTERAALKWSPLSA